MKKKSSSFRGKTTHDAKRQQSESGFGCLNLPSDIEIFIPKPNKKNKAIDLDFIPYEVTDKNHPDRNEKEEIATPGTLWYKRPYFIHRNVGVNTESVVCLKSVGKKCPICEYQQKRIREKAPKEEIDGMKSTLRNLYIVIPRDSKEYEAVPHIFDMSQFLFQKLLNQELDSNDDFGVFPDLEEGLTLSVRFEEDSFAGNKFAKAGRIDFIPRKKAIDEAILEEIPNLDKVLKVLTYDQLEAKFFDVADETSDEEDEDDEKPVRKGKKVVEDEDDDEDEDDKPLPKRKPIKTVIEDEDDDEDEEDEKPVKKSPAKKPAKKVVEEEDDDEDEDEDSDEDEDNALFDWDDISKMKDRELRKVCKDNKLKVDPDDFDDDVDAFRKEVAKALKITIPVKKKK